MRTARRSKQRTTSTVAAAWRTIRSGTSLSSSLQMRSTFRCCGCCVLFAIPICQRRQFPCQTGALASSFTKCAISSHRPLYARALHMVNSHAEYALEPPGQESFTIIQYNPADQYTSVHSCCCCCSCLCCSSGDAKLDLLLPVTALLPSGSVCSAKHGSSSFVCAIDRTVTVHATTPCTSPPVVSLLRSSIARFVHVSTSTTPLNLRTATLQ